MEMSENSFDIYKDLNEAGIARELARAILPVNLYIFPQTVCELEFLHFVEESGIEKLIKRESGCSQF